MSKIRPGDSCEVIPMDGTGGSQSTLIPGFDIRGLLPQRLDRYYRYNGSLTTPPCYQSVNWTIFNQTIKLAPEQLDILEDTIHTEHDHRLQMNYRGPQDLNSRLVLSNFKQVLMGRRGPAVAPNTDDSSSHEGPEAQEAHAMSTGDMLAILFGVLFVVTACAFFVYIRKTHKRNARSVSENKSNVIYKAATTEENVA
ncbi:carbonic anhydrase 9-like [Discoglossus pictus]